MRFGSLMNHSSSKLHSHCTLRAWRVPQNNTQSRRESPLPPNALILLFYADALDGLDQVKHCIVWKSAAHQLGSALICELPSNGASSSVEGTICK